MFPLIMTFQKNYIHFESRQSNCNTSLQNLTTCGYCVKIILSVYNITIHIQLYNRGCTNPVCQVAMKTKFCMVYLWILSMELLSRHPSGSYNC